MSVAEDALKKCKRRWLRQFKHDPSMALVLGTRLWVAHNTLQSQTSTDECDKPWPIRLRPHMFPELLKHPTPSARRKGHPRHRTHHATLQFCTKLTNQLLRQPSPSTLRLADLLDVLTTSIKQQNNKTTHKFGDTVVNGTDVLSMLQDVPYFRRL